MVHADGKVHGSDEVIKLGCTDGKVLGTILGNAYRITLGIYIVTELCYLDGSFNGYNDINIEGLLLGGSLGYTDGKVIVSDEGIKMGSDYGKVLGTILVYIDVITLGIDVGTYLVSLDESFDGSNDGNIEGLFIGKSLVSSDGKVFGSDEGIKLGLFFGKVLGTILGNLYGIAIGLDIGT